GVVLADAAYQAGPPDIHEASLFNIQTFFGWVSTTAQFCEVFEGTS
ncbi:MAG: pyrimidine utilization protein B, partial [Pseudomonadota bacterium]|nr:pyrimidine utilization protein B [Pseudomonadota bacterium]